MKTMLKHVVTWKMKEENKQENMKEIKSKLEALVGVIDEIKSLQVGINENGGEYDIILITDFEDKKALEAYDAHPAHQAVRQFVRSVVETRIAVDYNY